MGNNAKYGMAAWNGRGTRNAYNLHFSLLEIDVSLVRVAAHGIFVIVSSVCSQQGGGHLCLRVRV